MHYAFLFCHVRDVTSQTISVGTAENLFKYSTVFRKKTRLPFNRQTGCSTTTRKAPDRVMELSSSSPMVPMVTTKVSGESFISDEYLIVWRQGDIAFKQRVNFYFQKNLGCKLRGK